MDHPALILMPKWRRVRAGMAARTKHLMGIHTYLPTLTPEMDEDGLLVSVGYRLECLVCNAAPGER